MATPLWLNRGGVLRRGFILRQDIASGVGVPKRTIFSNSGQGVYITPQNVQALLVECVGGGGGGGGCATAVGGAGSGLSGGGGAYASTFIPYTSLVTSYAYTVGADGAGGAAGANNGVGGNDTSFGSVVLAKAGAGGTGQTAGVAFPAVPGLNALGGDSTACIGDIAVDGGRGAAAFIASATVVIGSSGGDGAGPYGGHAVPGRVTGTTGIAGNPFGGGGGGGVVINGSASAAGGNGRKGIIVITEYY
jgi:hypothetical protein